MSDWLWARGPWPLVLAGMIILALRTKEERERA